MLLSGPACCHREVLGIWKTVFILLTIIFLSWGLIVAALFSSLVLSYWTIYTVHAHLKWGILSLPEGCPGVKRVEDPSVLTWWSTRKGKYGKYNEIKFQYSFKQCIQQQNAETTSCSFSIFIIYFLISAIFYYLCKCSIRGSNIHLCSLFSS